MPGKRRRQGATRLSGRNVLETLNDILRMLNLVLPETERFPPVKTPGDLFALRQTVKKCTSVGSPEGKRPKELIQKVEILPNSVIQAFSTIATNAWRLRNKMIDVESGEPKDEMRRVCRHVEAILDALSHIGVEVKDMKDRAYDTGMALKVITFEKTPGLTREKIVETIRPTVTFQGSLIQIGEVIVGTPEAPQIGPTHE